jgi:four helix bundle protein
LTGGLSLNTPLNKGFCTFGGDFDKKEIYFANFKQLNVWNRSIELATTIYRVTNSFPPEEKFGLVSQIRRASVSVSSNIAEGAGRRSNKEFRNFLGISRGSIFELETQLIIAGKMEMLDLGCLENILAEITEIQKMIFRLERSLQINE